MLHLHLMMYYQEEKIGKNVWKYFVTEETEETPDKTTHYASIPVNSGQNVITSRLLHGFCSNIT